MRVLALAFLLASALPLSAAELSPETVNRAPRPDLGELRVPQERGSRSGARPDPSIVRLQTLLDRAHASPGVIDGLDGENVRGAIAAFREMRGLPPDGRLDEETWRLLTESGAPVLVRYTVTEDDLRGPFEPRLSRDYGELARLRRIPFRRASEMLAERFHMDEDLLRALNQRIGRLEAGDEIVVADPGEPLRIDGRIGRIVVELTGRVRVLAQDGALLAAYPATVGSGDTPSPEGTHRVTRIARNPTYNYDPQRNFRQGNNRRRLTLPPGPNNPVGSVWIALSRPTYGLHGTPEPAQIGKTESHGCVRLTNWDAEELAGLVHRGLTVEFRAEAAPQAPTPPDHPLRQRSEATPVPPRPGPRGTRSAALPEPSLPAARPAPEPPAALSDAEHEACLTDLRTEGATFEAHPPIEEGQCRAARPIRLTALGEGLSLTVPLVTLCRSAAALRRWVREEVQPIALRELGAPVSGLVIGGSYECRNRNRATAGPISEHAFANAVDVMGFLVRGRRPVSVGPAGPEPGAEDRFLSAVRSAACRHFTTVIGPGTDAAHADHFHLDLRERRRGYRLCQ